MPFSEVCNGHKACPFCKRTQPNTENPKDVRCCARGTEAGFWSPPDETDEGVWMWTHGNDECHGQEDYVDDEE